MYRNFYGLQEKPFEATPDPRFLYLGESHQEALARLIYAVHARKGFLLLTGDVGTGKTTLLNALRQRLNGSTRVLGINNPRLTITDLYRTLYVGLGFKARYRSKVRFLRDLQNYLIKAAAVGQNVLLVIDEAQALPAGLLEEIRLLSNLETPEQKLVNIFLAGQPELREKVGDPRMRALSQRIAVQYHLGPLDQENTAAYVRHRLHIAGTQNPNLFSRKALALIHRYSQGYPRVINILCDSALVSGFVKDEAVIGPGTIQECAREMNPPRSDLRRQGQWSPAKMGPGPVQRFFSRLFRRRGTR